MLGSWILPNKELKLFSDLNIKTHKVSSSPSGEKIPAEHYEKLVLEIFKLSQTNVIYHVKGLKRNKIYETTIYYTNRKILVDDKQA